MHVLFGALIAVLVSFPLTGGEASAQRCNFCSDDPNEGEYWSHSFNSESGAILSCDGDCHSSPLSGQCMNEHDGCELASIELADELRKHAREHKWPEFLALMETHRPALTVGPDNRSVVIRNCQGGQFTRIPLPRALF